MKKWLHVTYEDKHLIGKKQLRLLSSVTVCRPIECSISLSNNTWREEGADHPNGTKSSPNDHKTPKTNCTRPVGWKTFSGGNTDALQLDHLPLTSVQSKNGALCCLEKTFPLNIILAAVMFPSKLNWQTNEYF